MQTASGVRPACKEQSGKEQTYAGSFEDVVNWSLRWWCACDSRQDSCWRRRDGDPEILVGDGEQRYVSQSYAALPVGPQERRPPRFVATEHFRPGTHFGPPHRQALLLYLGEDEQCHLVKLAVYPGSLCISHAQKPGRCQEDLCEEVVPIEACSLSPFTIVDRTGTELWNSCHIEQSGGLAAFKLTVVRAAGDRHYHFATTGSDADSEREAWLVSFGMAIRELTCSLFLPNSQMDVRPVPCVPSTISRIMAGYLIKCESDDSFSLLYAELHANFSGEAKLIFYKDEWCDQKVFTSRLRKDMEVHSCKGVDCGIFAMNGLLLAARTRQERALWLRASSNIQVKLMYEAPDPSNEELTAYRAEVLEHILKVRHTGAEEHSKSGKLHLCFGVDGKLNLAHQASHARHERHLALLPPKPRLPIKSPRGDEWCDIIADVSEIDVDELDVSEIGSRPVSRAASRASFSRPGASEEQIPECRVAQAVELLDHTECRQLLKPFEVDLDSFDSDACAQQTGPGALEARIHQSTFDNRSHQPQSPTVRMLV